MLEAMPDALALPGCVLQKDTKRAEVQAIARDLQALGARSDAVRLARTPRTARMHDEVVRTQGDSAQHLFTKRGARFFKDQGIGSRQVDEIVAMNDDGRNPCLSAHGAEALDLFTVERARTP